MKRLRVPLSALALALLVATAGCRSAARDDPPATPAPAAASTTPATATTPADPGRTVGPTPTGPRVTAFTTTYGWAVPSPAVRVTHPVRPPVAPPPAPPLPYLVEIHAADHPQERPAYSRISFSFRGGFPSYELAYARQVEADGTGDPIALPGNSFLRIGFEQAQAHDESGRSTITTAAPFALGLPNLRGYGFGGDFEGYLTYGLGIQVAPGSDQVLPIRVSEVTRSDGLFIVAFDVQRG